MSPIKQKIHQLIDECDDEFLLEETRALLENANETKDWWNELSEEDKSLVMESETRYGKDDFISHKDLMEQFEAWKKK